MNANMPQTNDPIPTPSAVGNPSQPVRRNLREAKAHLAEAGAAVKQALNDSAEHVRADLAASADPVREHIGGAANSASAAAAEAGAEIQAQAKRLLAEGQGYLRKGESVLRQHPLAAVGIALAGGYLVGRLARR